jgi:hypothetical protein
MSQLIHRKRRSGAIADASTSSWHALATAPGSCGRVYAKLVGLTLVVSFLAAKPADAQSPMSTYYGSLGAMGDLEGTGDDVWRPGLAIDVGKQLSRQWSIRLDLRMPGWGYRELERELDYLDPRTGRVVHGPVVTRFGSRTLSYAGLVGRDLEIRDRARVTLLVGAGVVNVQSRTVNRRSDTGEETGASESSEPAVAIHIGSEMELKIAGHASVVGQAAFHVGVVRDFNEVASFQPTVMIRFR